MTFTPGTYANFIADLNPVFQRVSPSYTGASGDFDVIIVGSGIGGGVLADALADKKDGRRILVLEAGTFLYPTHVYNCSRLPNDQVANRFGCRTFWQQAERGDDGNPFYIGALPQMNLGGRSIFWSGLIPTLQDWELNFFPDNVRAALKGGLLDLAGKRMNESQTLGDVAKRIVDKLRTTDLAADFEIVQTPRALHQPYLQANGEAAKDFPFDPTGVFNTAELLVNQLKLSGNDNTGAEQQGLKMLLNHYVEDVIRVPDPDGRLEVVSRNTLTGEARFFRARSVVLAAGSIESPKLLQRSTIGRTLEKSVQDLVGVGLTDHPTTSVFHSQATHIDGLAIPRGVTAKIIFYSKGNPDGAAIKYPFNIEMNVNHEYWHLRENDPSSPNEPFPAEGPPSIEIKFSFGNPLDPDNAVLPTGHLGYIPEIRFRNQSHTDHLRKKRFPALAGWPERSDKEIFDLLNGMARKVIGKFDNNGAAATPFETMGERGHGFGWGTVHHAVGSLRMPNKARHGDQNFAPGVVKENLEVRGDQGRGLYVCDMSVMPFSAAANPVRHLAALALRLADDIA